MSLVREIGVQCGSEVTEKGALLRRAEAAEAARRVVGSKNLVRWSGGLESQTGCSAFLLAE